MLVVSFFDGLTVEKRRATNEVTLSISETIRARIIAAGGSYYANDCIREHIRDGELEQLEAEVAEKAEAMLRALVIDVDGDHNTQGTAKRLAKMYIREVFSGRYTDPPAVTDFPNAKHLDEIYTVGPIAIRSACSHHFCPIEGHVWVGVIPSERVIGLSKFARLTDWIMSRPQIQEEAIVQLADEIEAAIRPRGLGVVMTAKHTCMSWRGVKDQDSTMTSSVMRGLFRTNAAARAELLSLIKGQRFACR